MDALSRIEPVARALLDEVDRALGTLGAPVDHPVWLYLRRVGATPADAVAFFVDLTGVGSLGSSAKALREQADGYAATIIPTTIAWHGGASEAYTAKALALDGHLRVGDSMAARLETTASYVDEVARWQQRSRDRIAGALADVLTSAQAVSIRAAASAPAVSASVVVAAADIGAWLLAAVAESLDEGHDLGTAWERRLVELPYQPAADVASTQFDATIHLNH
jgi:hypothetical protein